MNRIKYLFLLIVPIIGFSGCSPASSQSSSDATSSFSSVATTSVSDSSAGSESENSVPSTTSAKASVTSVSSQSESRSSTSQTSITATSTSPTGSSDEKSSSDNREYVTVSIIDDKNNYFLKEYKVVYTDGMTAYTALKAAADANKIYVDKTGSGSMLYVRGINNLYERDIGPASGWLYKVNGSFNKANLSAGMYKLMPNDKVEWVYTTDMGKAQGADN